MVYKNYNGRILCGDYSDSLKLRVAECINSYNAFENAGNPAIPYLAAWDEDNHTVIWYEFIGRGFQGLLGCEPSELVGVFQNSIEEQYIYKHPEIDKGIKKETINCDELNTSRNELREASIESGNLEAIYKICLKNGVSLWLKDQAVIEVHKDDGICLSSGCLTVVSKEMMAECELKIDHDRLDELVKIRTRELVKANDELKHNYEHLEMAVESIIQVLSLVMEEKDPYTGSHQRRVTTLAVAIGEEMGLLDDQIKCLKMAGTVHDLGKITIPMGLLSKPGEIHEDEFKLIEKHPQVAYNILKPIGFSWPVDKVVLQHHERINGTGYPQGLSGNDILPEAKVLAVADVIDAMTFHRPYRPSLGIDMALDEIEKNKDVLYGQGAVDACLRLFREKAYHMES